MLNRKKSLSVDRRVNYSRNEQQTTGGIICRSTGRYDVARRSVTDVTMMTSSPLRLRRCHSGSYTIEARSSRIQPPLNDVQCNGFQKQCDLQSAQRFEKWRMVEKNGECTTTRRNISELKRSYMSDMFTTVIDMKWRYNLMLFFSTFIGSWIVFAFCWWLIAVNHGDIDHAHDDVTNWTFCVNHVVDFKSALLYSIETQQTIGYGYRYVETECPVASALLMAQCSVGALLQGLVTGLIFVKLSQPKRRANTLMFSENAVICMQDNRYRLLFRVGDMRKTPIISVNVHAYFTTNIITSEGEAIARHQTGLQLTTDGQLLFLPGWPVTVTHTIDKDSPLWNVSKCQLGHLHFEIIVILEGIVEATGMTTQARASYLSTEILWGHQLRPLLSQHKSNGQYIVDYSYFNSTLSVAMPRSSAADYRRQHADDVITCACRKRDSNETRTDATQQHVTDMNENCFYLHTRL